MSLDTVKHIMEEAGSGYLATTDGDRAYVWPMGSPEWVGSEYFSGATDPHYAVLRIKVETIQLITPEGERSVQPPR